MAAVSTRPHDFRNRRTDESAGGGAAQPGEVPTLVDEERVGMEVAAESQVDTDCEYGFPQPHDREPASKRARVLHACQQMGIPAVGPPVFAAPAQSRAVAQEMRGGAPGRQTQVPTAADWAAVAGVNLEAVLQTSTITVREPPRWYMGAPQTNVSRGHSCARRTPGGSVEAVHPDPADAPPPDSEKWRARKTGVSGKAPALRAGRLGEPHS